MSEKSRAERIRELEAELEAERAKQRAEEGRPPTLEEIKQMSPEQVERELQRLVSTRDSSGSGDGGDGGRDRQTTPADPRGPARMARGYAAQAAPKGGEDE
jgi:hypothetical protein